MLRPLKSIALACLRSVWRNVVAYGEMWIAVPEVSGAGPAGAAPGERHPERVRPDIPLSRAERAWERQIRDTA
nr:DUF6059 family protein [Streptomyces sp. Ru62]